MVVSLGLVHIAKVIRYIRYSMNELVSKCNVSIHKGK